MANASPTESFVQSMSDSDTFVKSAQVGDFVDGSSMLSMITRKHFTQVMVFPETHYKATITTLSNATYSTIQPIAGSEYINLLSRGDEVTINETTYRVSHGEFNKQPNGEWSRKIYWQPVTKTQ